ncbi:MAG TPA: hypothetical protein VGG61_14260 [Gemmataceae bacterium]|jgi:hypothetical protein
MPLPWGFGSMAFHGRVWRLTWRDAAGQVHFDNSNTDDACEAQRIMAKKALPRARAMVRALEAIANGTPYYKTEAAGAAGHSEARDRAEHGASRRPVRHDAAVGGDRGTTRGGKRQ